jgi:hypothetical protein
VFGPGHSLDACKLTLADMRALIRHQHARIHVIAEEARDSVGDAYIHGPYSDSKAGKTGALFLKDVMITIWIYGPRSWNIMLASTHASSLSARGTN